MSTRGRGRGGALPYRAALSVMQGLAEVQGSEAALAFFAAWRPTSA